MKHALYALALLAVPTFAQAAWSPALRCEGDRFVVDQDNAGNFQLVIRQSADTLRYFSEQADIDSAINQKGELIVNVTRGGPRPETLYVGAVNGSNLAITVAPVAEPAAYRVALMKVGYRGTASQELANWVFRDCSAQEE